MSSLCLPVVASLGSHGEGATLGNAIDPLAKRNEVSQSSVTCLLVMQREVVSLGGGRTNLLETACEKTVEIDKRVGA